MQHKFPPPHEKQGLSPRSGQRLTKQLQLEPQRLTERILMAEGRPIDRPSYLRPAEQIPDFLEKMSNLGENERHGRLFVLILRRLKSITRGGVRGCNLITRFTACVLCRMVLSHLSQERGFAFQATLRANFPLEKDKFGIESKTRYQTQSAWVLRRQESTSQSKHHSDGRHARTPQFYAFRRDSHVAFFASFNI